MYYFHLGVKYPRDQSEYKASFKHKLKEHIQTVHSRIKKIKNHSRDQCEFQSVNSSDLKRHINSVHLKILL